MTDKKKEVRQKVWLNKRPFIFEMIDFRYNFANQTFKKAD